MTRIADYAAPSSLSQKSMSLRALVTGGAGFIGSHIAEGLVREGFEVRVLDDLSTGRVENLAGCSAAVDLIRADICDEAALARAVEGVDVVFHEAAIASVPRSIAEPVETNRVNAVGTLRVLEAARGAKVRRVVFAASSAVYGNGAILPKREDLQPEFLSPYALQKYTSEGYLHLYAELHDLETVALRYFNVYGPRQDPKSDYAAVIPLFIEAALKGGKIKIYGDGEQTRDFVYISDVVRANVLAATADLSGGLSGQVFNVASGRETTVNELVAVVAKAAGREITPIHLEARAGDVVRSFADVSRIRRGLSFEPQVALEDGIAETLQQTAAAIGREERTS